MMMGDSRVNRKILSVLLVSSIVLSLTGCKYKSDTGIKNRNFPDAVFADYVMTFDSDNDGKLSQAECEAVDSMRLENVSDFKGLELFPNISHLEIANCYVSDFDFGSLQSLKYLFVIGANPFEKIDLSKNDNLEEFTYYQNNNAILEELILPQSKALKRFDCSNTLMKEFEFSGYSSLNEIVFVSGEITSLKIDDCPVLSKLTCFRNRLCQLEISGCPNLSEIDCGNNALSELDLSGCSNLTSLYCLDNRLTSLDLNFCPSLVHLTCDENNLTSLDLSVCPELETLGCDHNNLTVLDVSCCPNLKYLNCIGNGLKNLVIGTQKNLTTALVYDNELTSVNVSGCPALGWFICSENKITSLDISGCPDLVDLATNFEATTDNKSYINYYDNDGNRKLMYDSDVELIM